MTTIQKIQERDELVAKSERGEITPKDFYEGLKATWSRMSDWDKFVEQAISHSKGL